LAVLLALAVAALAIFGIVQSVGGDDDTPSASETAAPTGSDGDSSTADAATGTATGDTAAETTAAPTCDETNEVAVIASPDIAPVITQVAESADPCTTYAVQAQPSLAVAAGFAGGSAPEAHVWIPNSPAFATALAEAGVEAGPVVATSPVVLAAEKSVFEEQTEGLSEEPTWADLITAELPLLVGNPEQDPATMATLLSAQAGLGDSDAARALSSTLMVKLAQNSVSDPIGAVEQGEPAFAPTTAGRVAASADSDVELVGLTPRGGAGSLAYPYVVLPGAEEAPGVAELREALLAPEAAAAFEAAGFAAGDDAAPTPDAEAVQALTEEWNTLQPPSRLLAVIDVSGSMDEMAGEASRIQITTEAATRGLSLFPDDSAVGLWAFSTNRGPDGEDHVQILPVRQLTEEVDGATQRELLQEAVAEVDEEFTTGDTGLHDTILAAFRTMQEDWQEGFVSSVVLMTDGVNDDSTGGLSEEELIAELEDQADPERPVRLILIGMGPEVDPSALERVAQAAGGVSYVSEDPRDIGQVFVQAIAARRG
jgi:Mg-chelatase subunit ChlD